MTGDSHHGSKDSAEEQQQPKFDGLVHEQVVERLRLVRLMPRPEPAGEPEGVLGWTFHGAKRGAYAGVAVGSVLSIFQPSISVPGRLSLDRLRSVSVATTRLVGGWGLALGAMSAAFYGGREFAKETRGKDDVWNPIIGSASLGVTTALIRTSRSGSSSLSSS